MQIYTHAAVGLVVGMSIAPHNAVAQCLCIAGSIAPDIIVAPFYLIDRVKGRIFTSANWPQLSLLVKVTHSLIIWSPALLTALIGNWIWGNQLLLVLCAVGGLMHIIIDIPTHGGRGRNRYTECDNVGFLWPCKFELGKIFGIYEYRYSDYPRLIPKWPEAIFLAAVIFAAIYLYTY